MGLNPFGTGQCLSTYIKSELKEGTKSQSLWNRAMSFDIVKQGNIPVGYRSQSLWNRAMSFDTVKEIIKVVGNESQSLWNRAMSFDCSGVLEPCVARLPRATSQLFLMFE